MLGMLEGVKITAKTGIVRYPACQFSGYSEHTFIRIGSFRSKYKAALRNRYIPYRTFRGDLPDTFFEKLI